MAPVLKHCVCLAHVTVLAGFPRFPSFSAPSPYRHCLPRQWWACISALPRSFPFGFGVWHMQHQHRSLLSCCSTLLLQLAALSICRSLVHASLFQGLAARSLPVTDLHMCHCSIDEECAASLQRLPKLSAVSLHVCGVSAGGRLDCACAARGVHMASWLPP